MKYVMSLFAFLAFFNAAASQQSPSFITLKHVKGMIHVLPVLPVFGAMEHFKDENVVQSVPRTVKNRFAMPTVDGQALGLAKQKLEVDQATQESEFAAHVNKTSEELKQFFTKKIAIHYRKKLLGKWRCLQRIPKWQEFKINIQREKKMQAANKKLAAQKLLKAGMIKSDPQAVLELVKNDASFTMALGGSLPIERCKRYARMYS